MTTRRGGFPATLGSLLAPSLLASTLSAQESLLPYDTSLVILGAFDPQIESILDLDGDGDRDAVGMRVANSDQFTYLAHYENDGQGVFTESHTLTLQAFGAAQENPIEVGDIDQDGKDDYVLGIGPQVIPFFSTGTGPAVQGSGLAVPGQVEDMELADFNLDGWLDVAVQTPFEVLVYESTGPWTFDAPKSFTPLVDVDEMKVGKLSGGSRPDLLLNSGSYLTIVKVNSSGLSQWAAFQTGVSGYMLTAGDIDGDGDGDAVMFFPTGHYRILRKEADGSTVLEEVQVGGPATDLADVDGDGDLDGVCCGGGGTPPPVINDDVSFFEIAINDGSGVFAPSFSLPGLGAQHIAGADDLDGDGDVDLIAGRAIWYSRGTLDGDPLGSYSKPPSSSWGFGQAHRVADFDGDGDPDVSVGPKSVVRNDGAGRFETVQTIVLGEPEDVFYYNNGQLGDWDGDGDVDIVVDHMPEPGNAVTVFLENTGGGVFRWGHEATDPEDPMHAWTSMANYAADLDGDGDQDLLLTTQYPSGISTGPRTEIWLNDGNALFTFHVEFGETTKALSDVDRDGVVDLLVMDSWLGWRRNEGEGNFGEPTWFGGLFQTNPIHDMVALADFDGDGDDDMAAVNPADETLVLYQALNLQPGEFGIHTDVSDALYETQSSFSGYLVWATDADGDGWTDLLVGPVDNSPNAVDYYRNTGPGLEFEEPVTMTGYATRIGDADGDGDVDLLAGTLTYYNRTFQAPQDGLREQYGTGFGGSDDIVPVLGAVGPFRVGETAGVRGTGARGGAPGFLVLAFGEAQIPDFPYAGMTTWVDFTTFGTTILPVVADGPPGEPGAGAFALDYVVPAGWLGTDWYKQAFWVDPGSPTFFSATNGLHKLYGE